MLKLHIAMKTIFYAFGCAALQVRNRNAALAVSVILLGLGSPEAVEAQGSPNGNNVHLTAFLEGGSDFDGDGKIGPDEDADGDQVFGTLGAVPGFDQPEGIIGPRNTYNHVVIVTSGVFKESVRRTQDGVPKEFTIEAAPGVNALFDSADVDPAPFAPVVEASDTITLRNLTFRNTSDVIVVKAGGNLLAEGCRFEDIGRGFAVVAKTGARVVVSESTITRCGDKLTGEGGGVQVERGASVIVTKSTITGNFGVGVQAADRGLRIVDSIIAFNRQNVVR